VEVDQIEPAAKAYPVIEAALRKYSRWWQGAWQSGGKPLQLKRLPLLSFFGGIE
jgi:hypothetical protein